jgi:hypothetical protein
MALPYRAARARGRPALAAACLAALAVVVTVVGAHAVGQALAGAGSTDLHSYWQAGRFVLAGRDPYAAWLRGEAAPVPHHADAGGGDAAGADAGDGAADLAATPSNTAPMVLVLSPLAWLSWPAAKVVWLIVNLALAVLAPVLVWRLCPACRALDARWLVTAELLFLLLQGTRIAVWVGQTTLLVFVLMLAALLAARRRPIVAGLMLGLALSKYPVTLPAALALVYLRRWRALAVAVLVQVAGALTAGGLAGSSPVTVGQAYIALARLHTGLPGIHIGALLPPEPIVQGGAAMALTVAVALGWLATGRRAAKSGASGPGPAAGSMPEAFPFGAYALLAVLVPWGLLVVYHRAYDTLTVIVPLVLFLAALARPDRFGLPTGTRAALAATTLAVAAALCLPPSVAGLALPADRMASWYAWWNAGLTLAVGVTLVAALWLAGRGPRAPASRSPRVG